MSAKTSVSIIGVSAPTSFSMELVGTNTLHLIAEKDAVSFKIVGDVTHWIMFIRDLANSCYTINRDRRRTCVEVERPGKDHTYRSEPSAPIWIRHDGFMVRLWCQPESNDKLPILLEVSVWPSQWFAVRVTFDVFERFTEELGEFADTFEDYFSRQEW